MKCGGCVSKVKKLLEAEPPVVGASVNLATETAMVRVRVPAAAAAAPAVPAATLAAVPAGSGGEEEEQAEERDLELGAATLLSPVDALGQALAQVRPVGRTDQGGWVLFHGCCGIAVRCTRCGV